MQEGKRMLASLYVGYQQRFQIFKETSLLLSKLLTFQSCPHLGRKTYEMNKALRTFCFESVFFPILGVF